jgi:hypothetical protein
MAIMLTKVKENINKIHKAAGVELVLLADGRYRILLTVLTYDKKNIVIEKKEFIEDGTIELLISKLEKDVPFFLVLNGRGILHKKIAESGSDNNYLIGLVLPNAKAQDFYIQNIPSEKTCLVSIIRKEIADPILEAIYKSGLYCIGASFGGVIVTTIIPLLSGVKGKVLSWSEHSLEMDASENATDYKFQSDRSEKKVFQIDTEKIEDDYLISYAAAFSLLINNEPVIPFIDSVKHNKEDFSNKQLFKKLSWAVLGFFFVVLMTNFIFFANFSSKNNELMQKESKYSNMFSEMESLGKQVKEKEAFLSDAGWLQSSSMAYYADRIASTIPASVQLTEFSINPIDERKSKEMKKELFATGIIILRGDCSRPTELNEWLDKIKSTDKISKARLINYSYDNKENKGSFSIEIETES